jgi:hypothetical protein
LVYHSAEMGLLPDGLVAYSAVTCDGLSPVREKGDEVLIIHSSSLQTRWTQSTDQSQSHGRDITCNHPCPALKRVCNRDQTYPSGGPLCATYDRTPRINPSLHHYDRLVIPSTSDPLFTASACAYEAVYAYCIPPLYLQISVTLSADPQQSMLRGSFLKSQTMLSADAVCGATDHSPRPGTNLWPPDTCFVTSQILPRDAQAADRNPLSTAFHKPMEAPRYTALMLPSPPQPLHESTPSRPPTDSHTPQPSFPSYPTPQTPSAKPAR